MSINQQTELLSPAGDIEAGYAALYYGADAVYLGLPKFSARADAANFSAEELDAFVAYAHSINRKVYIALNTLVQESELPEVLTALQTCSEVKADAIIVQDLGIARIIKNSFPELELHASTQMAIHNLEGALALKKLGFTRVVLARELSLSEIQKIQKESGLEIEVFIHGALCYSYSGLCSFSSFETTRSANRGKCAYSCRGIFQATQFNEEMDIFKNGKTHLFSMKDLALEKDILKLKGVSLKIEGRKKNALYVAAVTDYYRQILNTGKADISLADNIKQIFARPWTKLHFEGKNKKVIDPDFVGHRGIQVGIIEKIANHTITLHASHTLAKYDGIQIDVEGFEKPYGFSLETLICSGKRTFEALAGKRVDLILPERHPFIKKGAAVYLASSSKVKGSYPYIKPKPNEFKNRMPIDVSVFITTDKVMACIQNQMVDIKGAFETANDISKVNTAIQNAFSKTGDTPFELKTLNIENPKNLFVPVSILNELRRQLYMDIKPEKIIRSLPRIELTPKQNKSAKWMIKSDDISNLAHIDFDTCDEIVVVVHPLFNTKSLSRLPKDKVRLSLPPITRQSAPLKKLIYELWEMGYLKWEIANLSGLTFIPNGADIGFDLHIPVLNTQSLVQSLALGASYITISPEDTLDNITKLTAISDKVCIALYHDPALFISANCVRKNNCSECDAEPVQTTITNGKSKYDLISKNCETVVTPQNPVCWANEKGILNAPLYRADFCLRKYTPEQAQKIWQSVQNGNDVKGGSKFNLKKQFA